MTSEDSNGKITQLEEAIAAQENLRGIVDDGVIDATIAALRGQIETLSQRREPDEQRKLVTILFVDVVASTQLLLNVDPEDHMDVMDNALRQLAEPVERLGGKLNRFMGDGFMAVFGLPKAKENDPEMAVRAGLAVVEKAQAIAQSLQAERELNNFQVRVGINTGQVMAGGYTEADNTIMGTPVNLAARIENAAPPGGVLISQDTFQHVRGLFNIEKAEALQMKGFGEDVQVFLVKDARPHSFRTTTRGIEGIETPMVGRQEELNILQRTIEAVESESICRFITVFGDAGLGKSRLLQEFEQWLALHPSRITLLKGRATLETMEIPFGLLRDLFASQFEILDDDSISTVHQKMADGFATYSDEIEIFDQAAHFVGHLIGYDFSSSHHLASTMGSPRQMHERGMFFLRKYFQAAARSNPVVIFLDDIHWSDESSLDAFIHLCEELSGNPVLIVANSRPTLMERRPDWGQLTAHTRLDLYPLNSADSRRLVSEVLYKVKQVPDNLSNLIVKNAEGNPYYLEELIKMLIEDGVITTDKPEWQIQSERLQTVRIPPTLAGVVQARLDSLPFEERAILQQASVVGKVFWEAAITYVCKARDNDEIIYTANFEEIIRYLASLQQRDMILENEVSTFSYTQEYAFKHTVLREVTYESVLIRTRRFYHSLIADWLIERHKERSGELSGLIATHLEKAGKKDLALDYFCRAAEAASKNYAIDEALEFYRRALTLTPNSDLEKKYSIIMGNEKVLVMKGNVDQQGVMLDEVMQIANSLDDDHKRVEVLVRKSWHAFYTGQYHEMEIFAHQAASQTQKMAIENLGSQANYALGWAHMLQNNHKIALEYAQKALQLARKTDDQRSVGNTLNLIGSLQSRLGEFMQARENQQESVKVNQALNDQERQLTARINLNVTEIMMGNHQKALKELELCLALGKEKGDFNLTSTAAINAAWAAARQGNWSLAVDHAREGIQMKRKIGQKEALAEVLNWLGNAHLGQGKMKEAIEAFQESIEIRREMDVPHLVMEGLSGLAAAELAQGNLSAAEKYIDQILTFLDDGNTLLTAWEPMLIYWRSYQVLKESGNPRAERLLEDAYQILNNQAEKFPPGEHRQRFLDHVPGNTDVLQAWEKINQEQ
ncbi:MAG: tetratricopeptide repeat protein [candidate division Zixibacteria bacterium]|nr:tetratricopeptide repeat protein [Gammaproteobacteria bacterium]NIX55910.1 tetratricopeptide repeat protein [candidate division Zixibacteria bacterium]